MLAAASAVGLTAQEAVHLSATLEDAPPAPVVSKAHADASGLVEARVLPATVAVPVKAGTTPLTAKAPEAAPQRVAKAPAMKAPATVADLAGTYVQTFSALTSSLDDSGIGVTIAAVEGTTDSIAITDFWSSGVVVKAKVDLAAGTVAIPSQVAFTHSTYGQCDIAFCTSTGAPDRTKEIVGTISDDGVITITSWWGMYVNSGDYADNYFYVGYNTVMEKANATMSTRLRRTDTSGNVSYSDISYPVVARQTSANVLSVKNFGDYGQTVDFILNRDETATIESQVVRRSVTYGDWYSYTITYSEEDGSLQSYDTTITTDKSTSPRTISWGPWSTFSGTTSGTRYYSGINVVGSITTDFDISYPKLSVSEFEGKGTEAEPYLLRTLDDLLLLSDKVAEVDEFPCTTPPMTSTYARVYLGEHFRIENDIDMSGYRFTPIGADWQHVFAGSIDGAGHTLTGLEVATNGTYGYGGLVGHADTLSVIKNITVVNPSVAGSAYSGAIVGWSNGTVENCHVSGGTITSSRTGAGGIAGIVATAKDCSVSGTVLSALGYTGGVAGEIDKLAENCHAEEVTIVCGAYADGYPHGGVTGSAYKADLRNCYFKGTIDCLSLYAGNQVIGGVAGSAYRGTVDQCFAVVRMRGYDSKAYVGGVVGNLAATLTNCYSIGRVDDLSSRYTGGIVGYLNYYQDSGSDPVYSTIKNCYTATQMTAETYQYDTATEYREVIGTIAAGTTPVIENVYFDNQVQNFTSVKYGVPTATLTSADGPAGFSADIWQFTQDQYPRLKASADTETALYGASSILMGRTSSLSKMAEAADLKPMGTTTYSLYKEGVLGSDGHFSSIADGKLTIGTEFGTDTLFVVNGKSSYYLFVKVAPVPFEGMGTAEDPYLIQSKSDLIALSQATTVNKQLFPDVYFKMTNDIDLEYDPAFLSIASNVDDAHNKFAGHFDGGGYAIHRMDIEAIAWTEPITIGDDGLPYIANTKNGQAYKGFIGRLDPAGSVSNLSVAADCRLTGCFATTAAIVGQNEGLIENCRNYADVSGFSCWIGGIAGQNSKGTIRNCYNEGDITTGYFNAGGIAGTNAGIIENCANAGTISVKRYASNFPSKPTFNSAGGISGTFSNGIVSNCLNAGTIVAGTKAGGIMASLDKAGTTGLGTNDVTNTINYGTLLCADIANIGAFAGTHGSEGTISGNYYDAQVVALAAAGNISQEGINPVETAFLTAGAAIEGYDTELWQFDAGMYPVLRRFANEPKLAAARKVVMNIPTGITVGDLTADATLAAADGLAWTLTQGTVFTIDGTTLKVPAKVDDVAADTLTATLGAYVKAIPLAISPSVPLLGAGTEADPYIIATTDDWNAIGAFIDKTNKDLEGCFLKITADLDFAGKEFYKLACNGGATPFNGTLDGNGKTISNYSLTTTANYEAPIGMVGEHGTVKGLTMAGTVESAHTYSSNLVSQLYGKLVNCVNVGAVAGSKTYLAGLVGYAYSGAEITDCVNRGAITKTANASYTAGIAAYCADGVTLTRCGNEGAVTMQGTSAYTAGVVACSLPSTYIDCYNTAAVSNTGATTTTSAVAGIVAYANGKKDSQPYTFSGCYNTGAITGSGKLAGIVAEAGATAGNAVLLIDNCYNTGDIIEMNTTKAVSSSPSAGIIARYSAGCQITNCYNTGSIINTLNTYAAGIAGYYNAAPTADYPALIDNCYNAGTIIASGNQGAGIVAYASGYTTISNCYNTADIEGNQMLGGIVSAFAGKGPQMVNCYNTGNITGSLGRIGGLISWGSPTDGVVKGCWNSGNVASTSDSGEAKPASAAYSIGGLAGYCGAHFTDCYNVGAVKGQACVAGLVGLSQKNTTALSNCYNAGKVEALPDSCGSIVGNAIVDNATKWTESNLIENCYYLSEYSCGHDAEATGAAAVTRRELAVADLGEGYVSLSKYTQPLIKEFADNPVALLNASELLLDDADTFPVVTKAFNVGGGDAVAWTSDCPVLGFAKGFGIFVRDFFGPIVVTATVGELSKSYELQAQVGTDAIDELTGDADDIVSARYFNAAGVEVAAPTAADGRLYIVVATHADGTVSVAKRLNK